MILRFINTALYNQILNHLLKTVINSTRALEPLKGFFGGSVRVVTYEEKYQYPSWPIMKKFCLTLAKKPRKL